MYIYKREYQTMMCALWKTKWRCYRAPGGMLREGCSKEVMLNWHLRDKKDPAQFRAVEGIPAAETAGEEPRVGSLLTAIFFHFLHLPAFLFQDTLTTLGDLTFTCGIISLVSTSPLTTKFEGAGTRSAVFTIVTTGCKDGKLACKYLLNEWMNE